MNTLLMQKTTETYTDTITVNREDLMELCRTVDVVDELRKAAITLSDKDIPVFNALLEMRCVQDDQMENPIMRAYFESLKAQKDKDAADEEFRVGDSVIVRWSGDAQKKQMCELDTPIAGRIIRKLPTDTGCSWFQVLTEDGRVLTTTQFGMGHDVHHDADKRVTDLTDKEIREFVVNTFIPIRLDSMMIRRDDEADCVTCILENEYWRLETVKLFGDGDIQSSETKYENETFHRAWRKFLEEHGVGCR